MKPTVIRACCRLFMSLRYVFTFCRLWLGSWLLNLGVQPGRGAPTTEAFRCSQNLLSLNTVVLRPMVVVAAQVKL